MNARAGKLLREVGAVDFVELVVERQVRAEHLHRDQVVHRHLSCGERLLHSVKHEPNLLFDICRRFAGCRIDSEFAGEIQRVADEHAVAERQRIFAIGQNDVTRGVRAAFLGSIAGVGVEREEDRGDADRGSRDAGESFCECAHPCSMGDDRSGAQARGERRHMLAGRGRRTSSSGLLLARQRRWRFARQGDSEHPLL